MNTQNDANKTLHLILCLVLMAVTVGAAMAAGMRSADAAPVEAYPRLLAVKLHADWCGSCKAIEPRFVALRDKHGSEPVLFTRLDLTDEKTQAQAYYLAVALELGDIWNAHASQVGYVLLIDTRSKRVIDKLTTRQDLAAMEARLLQALRTTRPH